MDEKHKNTKNPIQVKIDADRRMCIETSAVKSALCNQCKMFYSQLSCDDIFGSDKCAEVLLDKLDQF